MVEDARASVELALRALPPVEQDAQLQWQVAAVTSVVCDAGFTRLTLPTVTTDSPLHPGDVVLLRTSPLNAQSTTLVGIIQESRQVASATLVVLLPRSALVCPGSIRIRALEVGLTPHRRMFAACSFPTQPSALFTDLARGSNTTSSTCGASNVVVSAASPSSSSWIAETMLGGLSTSAPSTTSAYFASLDESQRAAAEMIAVNDVSLIQGPPGKYASVLIDESINALAVLMVTLV